MKIFKFFIASICILTAVFGFSITAKAVTIQELMDQIASLQAQLRALQAQQDTTQTWCHTFNANIGMGHKTGNPEIEALVIALQKEGILEQGVIFPEGYDETLASAVTEFQEKYASEILTAYNLKHGTGFVGKSTRAKLNALYGCKGKKECVADTDCPQPSCAINVDGTVNCPGPTKCIDGKCIIKPTLACTDSDGGLNPYIYGSTHVKSSSFELKHPDECALVSDYDNNGKPVGWQSIDFCSGKDCYIQEAYCRTDENGNVIDADADELINCPNGCENGACKKDPLQPAITITSPNGGETLPFGMIATYWTSTGITNASIYLQFPDGGTCFMKTVPASQDNAFISVTNGFQCPNISRTITSGQYKLFIIGDSDNGPRDFSDNYFTISSANEGSFSNMVYSCYDNSAGDMGGPTSCKPSSLWQTYANQACQNKCSTTTGKCGLNNFSVSNPCSDSTKPSITVTSPNGGEGLYTGQAYTIKWNSTGISASENIKIELSYNHNDPTWTAGNRFEDWIIEKTPNTGSYSWTIPEFYGLGLVSNSFSVKVSYGQAVAYSQKFSIKLGYSNPSLKMILGPIAGETYKPGDQLAISWTPYDSSSPYGMTLLKKNDISFIRWLSLYPDYNYSGRFYWTVPSGLSSDKDYYLRVDTSKTASRTNVGYSNVFTISNSTTQPSITVTSPNGGETWKIEDKNSITWSTNNDSGTVYINAIDSANPNNSIGIATANASQSGYWWTPTQDNFVPGHQYKIRLVYTVNGQTVEDSSDNYFTIASASNKLTASSAALIGTQSYYSAGQAIKFSVKGTASDGSNGSPDKGFNVQYRMITGMEGDNAIQVNGVYQVGNATYNYSTGYWDVTMTAPSSGSYTAKASFYCSIYMNSSGPNPNSICAQSQIDKTFIFKVTPSTQPSITVTSPNGGETYQLGGWLPISFSTSKVPVGTNYEVDIVGANNNEWIIVNEQTLFSGDGTQGVKFNIPPAGTVNSFPAGNYKLRIDATVNGIIAQDLSDNYFTIVAAATTYCSQFYSKLTASYNKSCGETGYDPVADVDKSKKVDLGDLSFYSANTTNETWCQQKLSETTSPCTASYNANDNSLASISDALAKIIEQIKAMLNK